MPNNVNTPPINNKGNQHILSLLMDPVQSPFFHHTYLPIHTAFSIWAFQSDRPLGAIKSGFCFRCGFIVGV
jgi:hypothetical protein